MKHDLSPGLREALTEWLKWAESGAPKNSIFTRCVGLCNNMMEIGGGLYTEISECFAKEFPESPLYPFETQYEYANDSRCDLNPRRLAWVREQLSSEDTP